VVFCNLVVEEPSMATTPIPAPEASVQVNHFGRIIGALFSPKKTFAQIAERPSWLAALLLMVVLGTVVGAMLNTKMNWGDYIRHKAEESPRFAQLSEERKDQALAPQIKFWSKFSYCVGAVGVPILALFFGFLYWAAFNLFSGAGLRFATAFAITVHAYLPSVIQSILAMIILPLKSVGDVDPESIVATNVKAFLGDDAPKWLAALGSSLDLFWIWFMVLAAIGFAAANPKKIKSGTAYSVVFGLWGVWVLAKVVWAAI
jgi:Yip1 domain